MIKIGLVVAMEEEARNIYSRLGRNIGVSEEHGFKVSKYMNNNKMLYLIGSGIGELNAALATQYLITTYNVDYIINFGVVGSFKAQYKSLDIVLVDKIAHYDFSLNTLDENSYGKYPFQRDNAWFKTDRTLIEKAKDIAPELPLVSIATGDKFVANMELRNWIIDKFDADICDMESMGIYYAAMRYNVPCLFIKAVSDSADDSAPVSFEKVVENGVNCYIDIVNAIIRGL